MIHVYLPNHFCTSARRLVRREVVSLALQGSRTFLWWVEWHQISSEFQYLQAGCVEFAECGNVEVFGGDPKLQSWHSLLRGQSWGLKIMTTAVLFPGRQESWGPFNTSLQHAACVIFAGRGTSHGLNITSEYQVNCVWEAWTAWTEWSTWRTSCYCIDEMLEGS